MRRAPEASAQHPSDANAAALSLARALARVLRGACVLESERRCPRARPLASPSAIRSRLARRHVGATGGGQQGLLAGLGRPAEQRAPAPPGGWPALRDLPGPSCADLAELNEQRGQ